jgi:hypothetical protein
MFALSCHHENNIQGSANVIQDGMSTLQAKSEHHREGVRKDRSLPRLQSANHRSTHRAGSSRPAGYAAKPPTSGRTVGPSCGSAANAQRGPADPTYDATNATG